MRTILLLSATSILLVALFFTYFMLQSGSSKSPLTDARAELPLTVPPPMPRADQPVAGPGEDVWVKSYDQKTGQVAFQFRAARYTPRPDGAVDVLAPQAELFSSGENRQIIRIEGQTGRVVMQSQVTQHGQIRGTESAAPRRGELHDVRISLFDQADQTRPLLVCTVNNVAFDNDTFRIATESQDDGRVAADQVPVEVRGDDFDFDGRGLIIRWNEVDRRLQLLEIAHGESLTIKSPGLLASIDGRDRPRSRAEAGETDRRATDAGKPSVAERVSAKSQQVAARLPPVYRATFYGDVRVTRGAHQIASAEQLLVDFIGTSMSEPARRAEPPARSNRRQPAPSNAAAASRAHSAAANSAASEPLIVRWDGKLRITALEGDAARPAPGSLNIAMTSEQTPVRLDHRGMRLTCASFDYRSGDDSLAVTSSAIVPMIALEMEDGSMVRTPSIVYSGADSKATLRGAGSARMLVQRERDAAAQPLHTTWSKSCVLTLTRGTEDRRSIESALLEGDVAVDHPELALRSDTLQLLLRESEDASKPALQSVLAKGSVDCKLIDPDGATRNIRCQQLAAEFAPEAGGRVALRNVTADGDVVALADDSELRAAHLSVVLASAVDRPAGADEPRRNQSFAGAGVQLQSLRAQKDVRIRLREGSSAAADQLDVEQTADGIVAVLLGQPAATLSDGTNTLSGPNIKFVESSQELFVYGPGTLDLDASSQPDQSARAVKVSWRSGLAVHGLRNIAEIDGEVLMASDAADGSKQLATAQRVRIALADSSAATSMPASVGIPSKPGFDRAGAISSKTVRSVTLLGEVQVQSVLEGADASQIRRMHLFAPEARYDLQSRRAEVPVAGRLLLQDTRSAASPQAPTEQAFGDFRGATAFQWSRELLLDQSANQMSMCGSVLIVHQDQSFDSNSFRLEAERVVADLLPPDSLHASAPSGAGAALGPSQVKLKSLTAEGDIRISASQIEIEAQSVVYDALHHLLTARGGERMAVQVYNRDGVSRGSFAEIVWNTRTEQIERMRQVQAQVRR